jgi:hypothetical protein
VNELPILVSAAGSVIALLVSALGAVLAWLGKFALETMRDRVEDLKRRMVVVEQRATEQQTALATSTTQGANDRGVLAEMKSDIGELRTKLDTMSATLTEVTTLLKRQQSYLPPHR